MKLHQIGFSLVELVVVIGIIGLIASISFASVTTIQQNSRDAKRQGDLRTIQSALQQFYADNSFYPNAIILSSATTLTNCTGSTGTPVCTTSITYLPTVPKDPVAGTANPYCYTSQRSSNNTASCASATPGTCHYYRLHARLENPSGTGTYTCPSSSVTNYNLEITPL